MLRFTTRVLFLAGFVAAIAIPAQAATIAYASTAALELDGRWYVVQAGNLVGGGAQPGWSLQAPVEFLNCRRPNNQMLVSNNRPFRWNAGAATIWLATSANADGSNGPQFQYRFDRPLLRLRSNTGDLVCEGEVAPPPGLDTLFRWGFE